MNIEPFRWDVSQSYALEHMLRRPIMKSKPIQPSSTYKSFYKVPDYEQDLSQVMNQDLKFGDDLIQSCAKIVAIGCNYDLVFVGRSLDTIYDYLHALLTDTVFVARVGRLNVSLYGGLKKVDRQALHAIRQYFRRQGIDPASLCTRKRPVAFVDIVARGTTFRSLIRLLVAWCKEEGIEWDRVAPKVIFIALLDDYWTRHSFARAVRSSKRTKRTRIQWLESQEEFFKRHKLGRNNIKNIFISWRFWDYLGNWQTKCSEPYPPDKWGSEAAFRPPRDHSRLRGLALAIHWHKEGLKHSNRKLLADLICQQSAMMKNGALRDLVLQLRRRTRIARLIRH